MPSFDQPSSSATPAWAQTDSHDEMDTAGEDDQDNVFRDMTFDEIMEELIARFMVNLPREETTLVRLYWQAEQAHWFYEDYLRPINPFLPSLSQKHFANLIIASSPIYANLINAGGAKIDYDAVWIDYMEYKRMVPTCGVILVNRQGTKVILVRGWKSSAGWSFPRGKINEKESEEACAIRELEEETGFDCSRMLNPKAKYQTYVNAQSVTMFFVTGVDENTKFAPKTRMEIGGIEWVKLKDLPTWNRKRTKTSPKGSKKFYNVTPFVVPLKRYLKDNGILDSGKADTSAEYIANPRPPLSGHDDSRFGHISPPSSLPPVSSHPITKPATTLDQLFAKFVNKQEEDLQTGGITVGGDNKAGLERLFGNMTVAEEEKQQQDGEASGSEDDALSRLLGAIGPSATPAPMKQQAPPPTSGKGGRLLAVLNQKAPAPSQPAPAPSPTPPSAPEPMVSRYPQQPAAKPHQASLLAVLSSQGQSNSSTPSSDTTIHGKPMSLPTSPRPASPAEAERKNKQRALLEMTIAGIGLDSNAPRGNEGTSYGQGHGAGHNEYQPQHTTPPVHGSYGASADAPRVTPPQTYGQQYRPPAPQQPQSYAPPPGTYYSNNQQHQPQQQQQQGPQGQQNHGGGGGPSPSRTRGAPPPYESHYAGQSGPSRPPPHTAPVQPPHTIDYSHHPQPQGMYQPRPPQPGPVVGQGYRPHQTINQPYIPSGFQQHPPPPQLQQPFIAPQQHQQQQQQQPFIPSTQQHPPTQYYNNQGGPGLANYQAPPPRPMPMPMPMASHQYQPPSMPPPPPQGQYAGTGHGQPYNPNPNSNVNVGAPGHTGQMHQPIPKNGPQTGMLLAMLNDTRGR